MRYENGVLTPDVSTGKQLSLFLKNGTLIVSAAAGAQVYFVSVFLSIQLNEAAGIAALLAFGVYGINNLMDGEEDFVNQPWDARFSRHWNRVLGTLSVVVYFGGVGLAAHLGGVVAALLALVPLTAQLVYSSAWLPFGEVKRLKQILVINSFIVAGAWVVKVVALPVALEPGSVPVGATVAAGLFVFVRWFMSVEVANVIDVDGDVAANVDSIPIQYGVDGTRRLMYGLEVVSALVLLYLAVTVESPLAVLAVLGVLGYSAAVSYLFCREGRLEYLSIVWDVSFVLMGIAVVLVDFAVGLPGGFF